MSVLNKDAKEILTAGLKLSNALADGFDWSDFGAFMSFPSAIDGWENGINSLNEAFKTFEGRTFIASEIRSEFDIPNDVLERKIEDTVDWLNATYTLYHSWTPEEKGE